MNRQIVFIRIVYAIYVQNSIGIKSGQVSKVGRLSPFDSHKAAFRLPLYCL